MVTVQNTIKEDTAAYSNQNENAELALDERLTDEAKQYSVFMNKFYKNARNYSLVEFRQMLAINDKNTCQTYKFDDLDIQDYFVKCLTDDYHVPVSAYVPKTKSPNTAIVIFLHSGGFQFFTRKSFHRTLGHMVRQTNMIWLSVEYRLSPEFKYPFAYNDCCSVTQWALENKSQVFGLTSSANVGVCGNSSGGNLAALIVNRFKKRLAFQILISPALDLSLSLHSYHEFNKPCFGLDLQTMKILVKDYLNEDKDVKSSIVSPLFNENFDDTPSTFIISAELDMLVDDARQYFEKLQSANISSKHVILKGAIHGFFDSSDWYMNTFHEAADHIVMFLRNF
jgi:acetyl esterase